MIKLSENELSYLTNIKLTDVLFDTVDLRNVIMQDVDVSQSSFDAILVKGISLKNIVGIEEYGGSVTCLDTGNMNENNECPIVIWSIYDEDGVVFLNEDFCSYFLELVEECI